MAGFYSLLLAVAPASRGDWTKIKSA